MINIAKYSASGNDFVIFHALEKKDRSNLAVELCNRQNGIGADGLIVLTPHSELDFEWEFYNSDGSYAAMCGNGSRACAHYAYSFGLAKEKMTFLTGAGNISASIMINENENMVLSELTPPNIKDKEIIHNNKSWWLIDTGVPHLITFDADIENFDILEARELRHKYNCNVNIASVVNNTTLKVRTYERGVEDETLACGTGMASAYYRAYQEKLVQKETLVLPKSNEKLHLSFENGTITFKGLVKNTFTATWRN